MTERNKTPKKPRAYDKSRRSPTPGRNRPDRPHSGSPKKAEPLPKTPPEKGRSPASASSKEEGKGSVLRSKMKATSTSVTLSSPPRRKAGGTDASEAVQDSPLKQEAPHEVVLAPQRDRVTPLEVHSVYPPDDDDVYTTNPLDVDMLGIGTRVFPPHLDLEFDETETTEEVGAFADDPSVELRIREIEERLNGLMASVPLENLDQDVAMKSVRSPAAADSVVDTAREILQSDYFRRNWGRNSLRAQSSELDDLGHDEGFEQRLRPALEFLFKKYFRVDVEGVHHIPSKGRAVVVANHSGALPFDGVMLRESIRLKHPDRSDLRWLAEDFSFYLPFLGVTLNRIGAVRACQENAERLLAKEHLVGVFPEGAEGIKKLYKDRYQLQRFGRGGFIRLCLRTGSPIVPCAIVGAEETNPIVYRFDNLSKLLGLDYLPITPTFPFLGPLGLIPAPTKWKIVFGEPISLSEYGPQAARDHVLVGRLSEKVRQAISHLLDDALRKRTSVWL